MLFRAEAGDVVFVEKLLGLLERKAENLASLPSRKFTFRVTLQHECLEKSAGMRRLVQVKLPGKLIWYVNGDNHWVSSDDCALFRP